MNQIPFFVYGTLIPGQSNDHYWRNQIVNAEPATLENAYLFSLGRFPMLIESQGMEADDLDHVGRSDLNRLRPNRVKGVLITVTATCYEFILKELDVLEGYNREDEAKSLYLRRERNVSDRSGQTRLAWAYIGKLSYTIGHPLIEDGDWVNYFQNCSV